MIKKLEVVDDRQAVVIKIRDLWTKKNEYPKHQFYTIHFTSKKIKNYRE